MAACRTIPMVEEALRLKHVPIADSYPFHLRMLSEVAREAASFDVIHNHHDLWMMPLTRLTDVPVLTTLHGRMDAAGVAEGYQSWSGGGLISISDSQRWAAPSLPYLRTIHHGIDLDHFRFHPRPGKYLAFLGRISPDKRPEWAIEVARRAGVPLKIAAKIEGQEGRHYYESRVKPMIDGRQVEFIGEISEAEKSDFLGNALALVFPIDWPEPFGLVMIESMACGTPVLARPCGAVPEILRDGVTGYVSSDLATLAARVEDVPQLDRANCRSWVEQRFSLKRMTEDYIDVYRALASGVGKGGNWFDRHRRHFLSPVKRTADGNP